ncbi:MAG: hypothetical protein MZW92_41180 [Comamonadaceae bacterium]|nr:hypothetical protein [Comamonadaceae bacterium]
MRCGAWLALAAECASRSAPVGLGGARAGRRSCSRASNAQAAAWRARCSWPTPPAPDQRARSARRSPSQLCAEGFDAELREVSSVSSLDGYAAIVLGSAVRYGDWLPEMLAFMRAHTAALQQRPLALFTACNKAKDTSLTAQAEMAAYAKDGACDRRVADAPLLRRQDRFQDTVVLREGGRQGDRLARGRLSRLGCDRRVGAVARAAVQARRLRPRAC